MRKTKELIACVLACLLLAGCGQRGADSAPAGGESVAGSSAPARSEPAAQSEPEPEPEQEQETPQIGALSEENAPARAAYAQVLQTLLDTGVLPDGRALVDDYIGSVEQRQEMSSNVFTVYDVDGDGREELVLLATTAAMAGMQGSVYDWDEDTGTLREQLTEFPSMKFYDNGTVTADWSHNQGKAGDFWPYNLYQYDPEKDVYVQAGSVDAWDKSLAPEGYPEEIDVSKTGFVYYIYHDLAAEWDTIDPVDERDYQAWLDGYLGGAAPLEVPYEGLTAENIQALTVPG